MSSKNQPKDKGLEVISQVFRDGKAIPPQYSCKGQNVNPPFNIFNVPDKAQSLTLIMHDPDAVSGDYLHWLVWDIPPGTEGISVNSVPVGAIQGANGAGRPNYSGPCPPKGTGEHHYLFDFYVLDKMLGLPAGSSLNEVANAQKGHVIDKFTLTGLFSAD